ncbi:site-2 protease family protein [Paracoccus suum]|uniref:Site-2 protease family protein n=1 Tax=Paracoccus suum TaxID=2259340 RepID=A0A344PMF4_9RHOB|nr:site-2 protease family protein [Paracoccus suum]AXC50559.1 site-2 protease family protein [Paracoccus suum]
MNISIQDLLFRLAATAIICAIHGFVLAAAAGYAGDPGPGYEGRRSLNPFDQMDPVGAISMVVFGFGWIRPIVLDPQLMRQGRFGEGLVAACGIVSILCLAAVASFARQPLIQMQSGSLTLNLSTFLVMLAAQSIAFAAINLVPAPPFTGAHFLSVAFPHRLPNARLPRILPYAFATVLIGSGLAGGLLAPLMRTLTRAIVGG